MNRPTPFDPTEIYGREDAPPVRALLGPHHYVQGPGVLDRLPGWLRLVESRRPALLLSEGGLRRLGDRVAGALEAGGVDASVATFGGECSVAEIDRLVAELRDREPDLDGVVGLGGGKCLDTAKCVARRLAVPVVSAPTIASTDAPCSAVSVLYTEEGRFDGVEHFPDDPALVVVDTAVIAEAPARFLVAGMGDALSTRYEALTCLQNPEARTLLGARMTVAGVTLATAAADVVLEHGVEARDDVREGRVTEAVERVVEANTLLSGMGFEGGGLAAAHALATGGLTALPTVHARHHHGERVAFGLLVQLVLEGDEPEARRIAEFLASVGLPVHLGQLSLDRSDDEALSAAAEIAASAPVMANEPFEVTPAMVVDAMHGADELGREVAARRGEAAYRELHPA